MIFPLIERTIAPCRQALTDAGLAANEIDEAVLVGGSTRISLVRRVVEEIFGRKPHTELNPDEVVALGAAVAVSGGRKLTTSFPRDFHADIVTAIEENPNLCDWIHLPVQSGSDRVLKLMRRGHTRDNYRQRIERIKSSSRRLALTSDLIVGFPGETEADFEETLRLVRGVQFDNAFVFKYSPRRDTPAAAPRPAPASASP